MNEPIIGLPCILDSNNVFWYYLKGEERITVWDKKFDRFADGGYMCNSISDGIYYLLMDDYITKKDYRKASQSTFEPPFRGTQ